MINLHSENNSYNKYENHEELNNFFNLINPYKVKLLLKKYNEHNNYDTAFFNDLIDFINKYNNITEIIISSKMIIQSRGTIPNCINKIIIKKSKISENITDSRILTRCFFNLPNIIVFFKTLFLSSHNNVKYNYLPNSIIKLSVSKITSKNIHYINKIKALIISSNINTKNTSYLNKIPYNLSILICLSSIKIKRNTELIKKKLTYTEQLNMDPNNNFKCENKDYYLYKYIMV